MKTFIVSLVWQLKGSGDLTHFLFKINSPSKEFAIGSAYIKFSEMDHNGDKLGDIASLSSLICTEI